MKKPEDQADRRDYWEQHWRSSHRRWQDHPGFPPSWQRKRRFLYRRFVGFLIFISIPLVVIGVLAYVLTRFFEGSGEIAVLVWLSSCGVLALLAIMAITLVVRSFRRMADPLANVMAAADAVADGDLSVRVPEAGPGELRRLASSFNRMVAELEHDEQQRRNLTADIAHELRTPIHIIQGNLEGIQDGIYEPTPEQISLLLDETQQLSRLVEDLRILSLAEAGQLPLEHAPIDVGSLLDDIQASFSSEAENLGVKLQTMIVRNPPDENAHSLPLVVNGDAGRLEQVLSNLVANALRFTPTGGEITLSAEARQGGTRIRVSDTGAGIPAEDLPLVFDRFWKGDPARQRSKNAGSGLGLAIARQLIQAQGGKIAVESQPGQGTTFTIDF